MTADSSSSTSHTLSGVPMMATTAAVRGEASTLFDSLQPERRHEILQPSAAIPSSSLQLVKETLEGFAAQVGELAEQRLKERRKRKRTKCDEDEIGVVKLRKVYVDGFETGQVWQQVKKIIGGVLSVSEGVVEELVRENKVVEDDETAYPEEESGLQPEDSDEEVEEKLDVDSVDEDAQDEEQDETDQEDDVELDEDEEDEDEEEGEDGREEVGDEEEEEEEEEAEGEEAKEFVQDPHGLNDGFFSIDDFNRETQLLEELDGRGNAATEQDSDDEEIDWGANPLEPSKKQSKAKRKGKDELTDDESDVDEDGPTFGDMSLDAPEGESEDEAMAQETGSQGDSDGNNANEIYYKDFFAPPRRKSDGKAKNKAQKKRVTFQVEPTQDDMDRAMADVRRDLFDDESEADDSADALSDVSASDAKSRRSAHERRQAKLRQEIQRLEAASVAKREWTLSGEATAADRPVNSLLEEDLDFEHVGKPVAVITPAISEDIEQLIKRRILARDFDEVRRRRPDADGGAPTRRGLADVVVDDSKPQRGLGDEYEAEHVARTHPAQASDDADRLAREERQVQELWTSVCARLDALSSWHYRPKPPAPALAVVSDVAAVSMEDAQPAVASALSAQTSRLAPQEVYRAADEKAPDGEVRTRAGAPVARAEMSREDRVRRRRRDKERARKAGSDAFAASAGGNDGSAASQKQSSSRRAASKAETVAALKRGGVKVINRRGEVTDVEGNATRQAKTLTSGSLKL